jgi:hypothetical protein
VALSEAGREDQDSFFHGCNATRGVMESSFVLPSACS